jgi:elongation factor 1 alpha-like protein
LRSDITHIYSIVAAQPKSLTTHRTFSASDFFRDAPWLNIPSCRHGEILIESLYPRGGLLGGSGAAPKVSKLAALAAARKMQAAEKAKENSSPSGESRKATGSLASLSRLGSNKHQDESSATEQSTLARDSRTPTQCDYKDHKNLYNDTPSEVDIAPALSPSVNLVPTVKGLQIVDLQALPSVFARTVLGDAENQRHPVQLNDIFSLPFVRAKKHTKTDAFLGPSPDDIVVAAQSGKPKGTSQRVYYHIARTDIK